MQVIIFPFKNLKIDPVTKMPFADAEGVRTGELNEHFDLSIAYVQGDTTIADYCAGYIPNGRPYKIMDAKDAQLLQKQAVIDKKSDVNGFFVADGKGGSSKAFKAARAARVEAREAVLREALEFANERNIKLMEKEAENV